MPTEITSQDAERVVTAIDSRLLTIRSIRESLREQMPSVMQELEDAEQELPRLQEEAKGVLRQLGAGNHVVCGHCVQVKNAPITTTVDIVGLVERAEDRGEIADLITAGVLKYDANPNQIARLGAKQRAIYESYLTTKTGTASITLPPELKS